MALRIQIPKFKFCWYRLRALSPNLKPCQMIWGSLEPCRFFVNFDWFVALISCSDAKVSIPKRFLYPHTTTTTTDRQTDKINYVITSCACMRGKGHKHNHESGFYLGFEIWGRSHHWQCGYRGRCGSGMYPLLCEVQELAFYDLTELRKGEFQPSYDKCRHY